MTDLKERLIDNSVRGENNCWLWQLSTNRGYGQIRVKDKMKKAHRVSYEEFIGPIPNGLLVRHVCNNTICLNPFHLLVGTHQDNSDDKLRANRQAKGADNGRAKLTEDQVREIRRLYETGRYSYSELARMFNVSKTPIHHIVNRQTWRHI